MIGRELEMGALLTLLEHAREVPPRQLNEMAYLAMAEGVPLEIPFRMHQQGPYSERLESDMAWLERIELIERVRSEDGLRDTLRLAWPRTGDQRSCDREFRDAARPHRGGLAKIGREYLGCTAWEIHADAAICMVARNIRERRGRDGAGPGIREASVRAVSGTMPRIGRDIIERRYDRMAALGRVPPE